MILNPTWDDDAIRLLPQTPQHKALEQAVQSYFMQAEMLRIEHEDPEINQEVEKALTTTLTSLKGLLTPQEPDFAYQSALALQISNELLETEGVGLALTCAEQGQPFVCTHGCRGCCCQLVLTLPYEAWLIEAYLRENPTVKEAFLANWDAWEAEAKDISQSYLKWGEAFYGEGIDDKSHSRDDYYIPCPFLDKDGACIIYAVRPYACRSSVAVDPRCATGDENGKLGMYNMLYSFYIGHNSIRRELERFCFEEEQFLQKQILPYAVKGLLK